MEQQQVGLRQVRVRGGWRPEETERLWAQVHRANELGEPLRSVFERIGLELGRKPNSIRNFYYAQLKEREQPELKRALPFSTFAEGEVRQLLRQVLGARAKGVSVRACVQHLADGDKTRMLRYQNKYRSTIKGRPQLVREVMQEMEIAGEPYIDPLQASARRGRDPEPLYREAADTVQRIGEPALVQMLEGLNHLLQMALSNAQRDRTQELDRLAVRHDLARIALADTCLERDRVRGACEALVQDIKEFLGTQEAERVQRLDGFCACLAERLPALEEALPMAQEEAEGVDLHSDALHSDAPRNSLTRSEAL